MYVSQFGLETMSLKNSFLLLGGQWGKPLQQQGGAGRTINASTTHFCQPFCLQTCRSLQKLFSAGGRSVELLH